MNLYLRLLKVLLLLPFVRRRGMLAESRLRFRVWPSDCDLNLHMNNGRYLTLMDLGRVHLIAQIGALRFLLTRRWSPVLSAAEINFIRPLPPFTGFELVTRMLAWDDKYFYLEQRFERGEVTCAIAMVRGLFLAGTKPLPTREAVRILGIPEAPPAMPEVVRHWNELTALKKEHAARSVS